MAAAEEGVPPPPPSSPSQVGATTLGGAGAAMSGPGVLRAHLSPLKLSALKMKAREIGVGAEALEEADDMDDIHGAVMELVLRQQALMFPTPTPAGSVRSTTLQQRLVELQEELTAMKLSQLKKRAASDFQVDPVRLEEADDAEDIRAAVIGLILEQASEKIRHETHRHPMTAHTTRRNNGSHSRTNRQEQSTATGIKSTAAVSVTTNPFGRRHVMLSYCHACCQETVITVRQLLQKRKLPVWLDISDVGMQVDIFDSMAAGVSNAACIVPFMSSKYEASANCALELKFAQQSGVPLVPVMMQHGYTAGSWLGILTAGLLWTPLFDPVTFDENIEQLVRQINKSVVLEDAVDDNAFSADDVKEELQRLRHASESDTDTTASAATGAKLPALVPNLPVGMRVTSEMKQILSRLSSSSVRVAFCGMGGIVSRANKSAHCLNLTAI
jgi:hypothetical protein